jgi:mono/diheme cytochrome c family protein
MKAHSRWTAAVIVAGAALTGVVLAQAGATPQGQPPAGQPTAQQPPQQPPPGRGAGAGGQGGAQGRQGGARRGGFTQFTRELAPQDVLVRGKGLYEANCASCHAVDLRGTADGKNPNLLRSGIALTDKHGELVAATVAKHTPKLTLIEADIVAIAEYIHSVHATMGGQGSPPGRNPTGVTLNVLVGDATSGEAYFKAACSSCHSITGDLKGIGSKYPEPRDLQNAWVAGVGGGGRFGGGGGRGGGGGGQPAVVTMADGTKIEGTLVRKDDWLVILNLPDGTRKSMARTPTMKIDVTDRQAAHKKMVLELDDPTNKKMHDVTAYLWTIK